MLFRMISDLIDLLTDEEEFDPSWMDKEKFTKMEEEKKYPCLFPYRCRDGAVKIVKPIECDNNCLYCAWNPEEQARRLEKGHFEKNAVVAIRHYSGEEDKAGTPVLYGGLRQLRFPPAVKKPSGESA